MEEENNQGLVEESPTAAVSKEAQNWAVFCHLAGLAGFLFPFGNVIGPLVIWLVKKDEFALVDDQGKEAVNFQISMSIIMLIGAVLIFAMGLGLLIIWGFGLFALVITIIAAIQVSAGKPYRYPLNFRLIK